MVKKAKEENKSTEHKLIPETPDWLYLPNPIVTDILLEHLEIDDYIRFSSVCKEWQLIQKEHRIRYSPYTPPLSLPFPWLRCDKDTSIYFYLPERQKLYNIPITGDSKCAYTMDNKHGWLILLSKFFMSIFNPVTGDQIKLPQFFKAVNNPIRLSKVHRIHLLPTCISSPLIDSECTILMVDLRGKLYLCRLNGNSKWKVIRHSGYLYCNTPVFIDNKIYDILPWLDRIIWVDTLLPDPFEQDKFIEMDCSEICNTIYYNSRFVSHVVNFLGELVLVIFEKCCLEGDDYDRVKEYDFHVYRADFLTNKWVTMKTLGDHAFFISFGSNFSLPADDVRCMKNTIYFAGDINGPGVAWRAFNLSTKNWIDGPPVSPSLSSKKLGRRWSWFLPSLDKWCPLN